VERSSFCCELRFGAVLTDFGLIFSADRGLLRADAERLISFSSVLHSTQELLKNSRACLCPASSPAFKKPKAMSACL